MKLIRSQRCKFGSPEHRAKLAASKIGKKASPETRAKMSAAHKGKRLTEGHRAKLSAANAGRRPTAYVIEKSIEAHLVHGQLRNNSVTPTYISWRAMVRRCTDSRATQYPHYGGRGILVCDRWLGPDGCKNFLSDMGARPLGTSLDRIKVDGDYTPENCRWATASEQRRNRRTP